MIPLANWKDDRKERREKEMLQHNDRPMVEVPLGGKPILHAALRSQVDGQSVPQLTERQAPMEQRCDRALIVPER